MKDTSEKNYTDYEAFIRGNRIKVNQYLNFVMWFCILTGPAIAVGKLNGLYRDVTYMTCVYISLFVLMLAVIHLLIIKKWSDSYVASVITLMLFELLLIFMAYSHVQIYMTWFLVPLLSILFCDTTIFLFSVLVNFSMMTVSTWLITPYYSQVNAAFETTTDYFTDRMGGNVIETLIMTLVGYLMTMLASGYFKKLIENNKEINQRNDEILKNMDLLSSMAEIYDNVNILDFIEMTEFSVRDKNSRKFRFNEDTTHTIMNQRIKDTVIVDQREGFLTFTNLQTLRSRLKGKKIIYGEFISVEIGWFRAQYITVETGEDGTPTMIIYTTQNIDNDKRREEHLIRISMTDEMTRLYNRRSYEENISEYKEKEMEDDLVIVAADINGLKVVNDTKGHVAGDELIRGAANCIVSAVGKLGRVFRIGGDEFVAIIRTSDAESAANYIKGKANTWHGAYNDCVHLAVGFAAKRDNPNVDINELGKIADAMMYEDKEKYYKENGIDRRKV
ncbi:MAG: GGDEF domain-containing protein [Eubacterium sp.]|nr:GGDEF domain-containing protein [Eubacterium sp.]